MRTILTLITATLLLGTAAASGTECDPEVDTGTTPAGQYYVDHDACQPGCLFSLWIYQESDGQPGCDGERVIL